MRTWESYIRQQAEGAATRAYQAVWHNAHACGELGTFDTKKDAERAAREWKREMVALERTPAGRADARHDYQWEIVAGWNVDGDFVAEGG